MEVAGRFHSLDVLPQGTMCTYWMIKKITLFYGARMGLNVTFRRTVLFCFTRRVYSPCQFCLLSLFLKDYPFAIACDCSLNNFTDINSISDKRHHYHRPLKLTDAIFSTAS